jgi:cytochrome c oxidase assembly protein subunit 15
MRHLAKASLLLVVILVSLSAYLRLAHSGIGCADWPTCYGRIGEPPVASSNLDADAAYARIVAEGEQDLAWATPAHRLVASVLGLMVLFLAMLSVRARRHRSISFALLGLTVFLAVIGIRSGGLHDPAIVMGNLGGGFLMLGLLGWLVFSTDGSRSGPDGGATLRRVTLAALVLLSMQIALGGLTSANFAATACVSFPDCQGAWLPGEGLGTAMDLSREHVVNEAGLVVGGLERGAIHRTHRLGAVLSLLALLAASILALRAGPRFRAVAIAVLILAAAEVAVGIAAVLTSLPIVLAVAHNWLAGLLLLALLKLLALQGRETIEP